MSERRPRRALVLGGGGVLGFAWMLGALAALEEAAGFDAREVDLVVGTSAGSVAAALLGCGLPVDVLRRHHQGTPAADDPSIGYDYAGGAGDSLPPRPGWRPASPGLLVGGLRHPRRISPLVALSGLLPAGRGTLQPVHDLVSAVADEAGFATAWPTAPRPWVVTADYRTGRRIVFGRDDLAVGSRGRSRSIRHAALADAVRASCSIPGWYPPALIDAIPYVDGGAVSNASLDVLRHTTVEQAFVLAPMALFEPDHPRGVLARAERQVRRTITRRIRADAAALRDAGVDVCLVSPSARDLELMGVNLMNPARRAEVLDLARWTSTPQLRRQLARFGHGRPGATTRRASGAAGGST